MLPRETAERWSTCQRVGCGHGPEHHVDDTAGRCHLCGCPHYLGRIEDDDEPPFPAPSEPSDKAMVLALSRELKDLGEELDLVSEQRDMIAAEAEKREHIHDVAYDVMVGRWRDDMESVRLAVDELECMLDVHAGDQAMPDVHIAWTKLREILDSASAHPKRRWRSIRASDFKAMGANNFNAAGPNPAESGQDVRRSSDNRD